MLRRSVKIQLAIFVVITLLGVSYVGANYVGLTRYVAGNGCTISADFPDSGGIFTNAEVTYRGVTVGRVGALHLISNGVRVDLNLDDCAAPKIPTSSVAVVADRSVVGEQYVNLVPPPGRGHAPYVQAHTNLPMNYPDGTPRNKIPVATQTLLVNLDRLVNSVPLDKLRTTVKELDQAVAGRGADLGRLLDATDTLLRAASAPDNLHATTQLIDAADSVLQTQLDEAAPLASWTRSLNLLAEQLKSSDPDIRHLLENGPSDLTTITDFVNGNKTDLGVTLANLSTVGNLLVQHLGGIEEVLEIYPGLAAGGPTTLHDGQGYLAFVLQTKTEPQDCGDFSKRREGYNGVRRGPENLKPIAPNVAARCTAPASGPDYKDVRGAAHVPGGDPISLSGGGYAYPRTVTDNTLRLGTLPTSSSLGDGSWVGLLGAALR